MLVAGACAGDRPTLEEPGASREVEEAAPSTSGPPAEGDGSTIRLAVGSGWSADPGDAGPGAATDRVIAALLYEGLTRIDRSGTAQPALAERWFVSDDRLVWTFVLPEGLTDNHGLAVTARDVKASLEQLAARGAADQSVVQLSPITGWGAFAAGSSGGATGITAADQQTLVIELDHPFEPLAEVLAQPAFGVTGLAADGTTRTTGAYTFGDTDELIAVDPVAPVARIELVSAEQSVEMLLADGMVDWGVLDAADDGTTVPGPVLRQPLDLRSGLVVRLDDPVERQAVLGALNGTELALELEDITVAIAPVVEPLPESLPAALTVHVPEGPLAMLAPELERQLQAMGVEPTVVLLPSADFADAVASGEAEVFPMVMAGSGFARSAGVAASFPGGVDDVFGLEGSVRAELVRDIFDTTDVDERRVLIEALDQELHRQHVWLPLGNTEVRAGLGAEMGALRVLPDGTFDLSGFGTS